MQPSNSKSSPSASRLRARRARVSAVRAAALAAALATAATAHAQSAPAPERSDTWQTVSTVSMLIGVGTQLVMPRIHYADSEVTIGHKARFHVSAFAPVGAFVALAVANEYALKPGLESLRPGCTAETMGEPGCTTFGGPSSHAFVAFAALGHGAAVTLVDTYKYSGGRFHAGAIVGNFVVPLAAAGLIYAGRVAGTPSFESGGQTLAGAGLGLGVGALLGLTYALFQSPECGYGAGVICW